MGAIKSECIVELYRNVQRNGDSFDLIDSHSTAVDGKGRYRFDHLDPGPWLVRVRYREEEWDTKWQDPLKTDHLPVVIHVEDHEPSLGEIDQSIPVAYLEGRLSLNGEPWANAGISLHALEEIGLLLDSTLADEDGGFKVRAREPGLYWLVVSGRFQHALEPRVVSATVELSRVGEYFERKLTWERDDPASLVFDEEQADGWR